MWISFWNRPEVIAKLKPFRPKPPRKIGVPLKVVPRSKNNTVVAWAFDYLIRFEIERRAPHAQSSKWGAEYAPDDLHWEEFRGGGGVGTPGLPEASRRYHLSPHEVIERTREVVAEARTAVAIHRNRRTPTPAELEELAGHCIGLGHLENVYRSGVLYPRFQEVEQADVQELLEMLAIVPFDQLLHPEVLLLSPRLGEPPPKLGGTADLISGDTLIDFKATKKDSMRERDLDQLLSYLILSRLEHARNKSFPEIKHVAFYFCRHGHLWKREATDWTLQTGFLDVEQWFIERAK